MLVNQLLGLLLVLFRERWRRQVQVEVVEDEGLDLGLGLFFHGPPFQRRQQFAQ